MISSLPVWAVRLRITILVVLSLVAVWLVTRDLSRSVSAQSSPSTYRNFEGPQIHPLGLTPVGLEPVSIAVRNNREAWVANWMSDSVSIVDLAAGNVVRTIDVGDEPTDILFAGLSNEKAFVCVSGGGTQSVSLGMVTGASGAVKVFPDASNPTQGNAQTIQIS